jgi:hypothetical protein
MLLFSILLLGSLLLTGCVVLWSSKNPRKKGEPFNRARWIVTGMAALAIIMAIASLAVIR